VGARDIAKTADQADDPVARAVAAVDSLLEQPKRQPTFEPQDEVSAAAAVERFAAGFASAAGWVKDVADSSHDDHARLFLVVVSHVEGEKAKPKVRVIAEPIRQLHMTETSSVSLTGVRTSQSLVYDLVTDE
jgi:hypothetical protein